MTKKPVSLGRGALILMRFKAAVDAAGLHQSFADELENMRQQSYSGIPYNINYKFSDPIWLNIVEDKITSEEAQKNNCAQDRAARHAQTQLDNLVKASENLNEHDEVLTKDQRSDLSDLMVDFYKQLAECEIIMPSTVKEKAHYLASEFNDRQAAEALIFCYTGQHYQNM